ncbi:hypothetical protein F4819DRAFT_154427 [Hypoxylon fuscum]|nr:hypothetical protein F4819DRAFT_154427 [Hypoxylon fuscum]
MRFTSNNLVILAGLACVVQGGFWSDILKGIKNANRFNNVFDAIGNVTTDELLSDEQGAAVFLCEMLHGDIPDVIEELPTAVIDEVEDDFNALTSFVGSLPSLVPAVFSEIVQGGEVVVSIVEEIVTAPAAALTVIEDGVVSVYSDITAGIASVVGDVTYFVGCDLFQDCPSSSFTDNGILSRCSSVMHAYSSTAGQTSATLTSSPEDGGVSATSQATPGTTVSAVLPSQTSATTSISISTSTSTSIVEVHAPSSTSGSDAESTSQPSSTAISAPLSTAISAPLSTAISAPLSTAISAPSSTESPQLSGGSKSNVFSSLLAVGVVFIVLL